MLQLSQDLYYFQDAYLLGHQLKHPGIPYIVDILST